MEESSGNENLQQRCHWWRSIGPALITACVVFGPGSLLVSANAGASYGYELLWMLVVTALLMGTYMSMAARIGVAGGASPCSLLARHINRPAAVIVGVNLFLICTTFQFGNNLAVGAAAGALLPKVKPEWIIVGLNIIIIIFLFTARHIYRVLERTMKVMVGVILFCFVVNLVAAGPDIIGIVKGFVPQFPTEVTFGMPQKKIDGEIYDPLLLIASLLGTTFSVAAAFYQGNLVREKGWGIREYRRGIGDSMVGVGVLTSISMIIMITTATVIPGKSATDVGMLAQSLEPLLGPMAYIMFCVGLIAVSMNPFLINAMIGGNILADGIGLPANMSDKWPRIFTVMVLLIGMTVAILAMRAGQKPIRLIIFGQALTVLGNPLMAVAILWLANRKSIMREHCNKLFVNMLGIAGLLIVVFMAVRVIVLIVLKLG